MNALHGPLISTDAPGDWSRLLTGPLGMRRVAHQRFDRAVTRALFGVNDATSMQEIFETPGTDAGVRIVATSPPARAPLRRPDRGTDLDALKVIDFHTRDLSAMLDALAGAGASPAAHVARYALPEGEIEEAHLWTGDSVVCAFLSGPPGLFESLVTVYDAPVSEVMGISAPVSDARAAHGFYRDGLGLNLVGEYAFESASFARLLGQRAPVRLRARNYGDRPARPFLGIVDYGAAGAGAVSLRGQAGFDRRGLIGLTVLSENVAATVSRLAALGAETLCPPCDVTMAPWGDTVCATVRAPDGIVLALTGRVTVT